MAWLSIQKFKTQFAINVLFEDDVFEMCLDSAIDELSDVVSEETISDTAKKTPTNKVRATKLVRAQGYLAYGDLILIISGRMRDGGIVETEHDAGSPTGPNVINRYLSPEKAQNLRDSYYEKAMKVIKPYLAADTQGQCKHTSSSASTVRIF